MASAELNVALKRDWGLANPWLWLGAGLGMAVWSWLWALTFQAAASDARVIVLVVGLVFAGVGVWLQWSDRRALHLPAFVPPPMARLARLTLGVFYALLAGGATVLLVLSIIQWEGVSWRPGVTALVWLTIAPLSWCAARRAVNLQADRTPIDAEEETGLAFLAAGLTTAIGSMALYLGPQLATDWDTIRLALRVLTAVTLTAGALAMVSIQVRRLVLSLVIGLHFCGIAIATLAAPPAPPVVTMIWTRVFHPYLEFMYLNNAYHFYAPEPGPSSFLWFRIVYEDAKGNESGMWHKLPNIDDEGRSKHPASLEYQRYLAMTESLVPAMPPPAPMFVNRDGKQDTPLVYSRRVQAIMGTSGIIIGHMGPKRQVKIPMHPEIQFMQQYMAPTDSVKRLVSSYAKYVAWKFPTPPDTDPDKSALKFKSVKAYRVVHLIPPAAHLAAGRPPNDPQLYRPIYMGNFNADGELVDFDEDGKMIRSGDNDPYLYWLIPIFSDNPADPLVPVKDYVRLHAGEKDWVRHCIVDGKIKRYVWTDKLQPPAPGLLR